MFAEILRRLRTERGFTQSGLAEKLGVSKQNISDWENGKSETSFEILTKIAKLFDVTVGQLIGSEEY